MKPEFDRRDPVSEDSLNFHRSPDEAIPTLLSIEAPVLRRFDFLVEPACGDGALVNPLRASGFRVYAADIADRGLAGAEVRDFFDPNWCSSPRVGCITNPPFNRAEEFVVRACALYDYVAMILRLRYLGPQHFIGDDGAPIVSGRPIWTGTRIPFARIILPASRWPMMHRDDYQGEKVKGGMTDSCWFIWERGHKGRPQILREPRSDILKRSLTHE